MNNELKRRSPNLYNLKRLVNEFGDVVKEVEDWCREYREAMEDMQETDDDQG